MILLNTGNTIFSVRLYTFIIKLQSKYRKTSGMLKKKINKVTLRVISK